MFMQVLYTFMFWGLGLGGRVGWGWGGGEVHAITTREECSRHLSHDPHWRHRAVSQWVSCGVMAVLCTWQPCLTLNYAVRCVSDKKSLQSTTIVFCQRCLLGMLILLCDTMPEKYQQSVTVIFQSTRIECRAVKRMIFAFSITLHDNCVLFDRNVLRKVLCGFSAKYLQLWLSKFTNYTKQIESCLFVNWTVLNNVVCYIKIAALSFMEWM